LALERRWRLEVRERRIRAERTGREIVGRVRVARAQVRAIGEAVIDTSRRVPCVLRATATCVCRSTRDGLAEERSVARQYSAGSRGESAGTIAILRTEFVRGHAEVG